MSPRKLNTLASRLNLRIHKNDRKFYKKYNYRLGFYYIQSIVDATEYFNTLGEMRVAVDLNDMHMRRERNKINIYADNLELMEKFIESYPGQDYVDIGYFPADIPPNVKLRKTEPEFPYEVKLGRNVKKETLKGFWENNQDAIWLNRESRYELNVETIERLPFSSWKPPVRDKTWSSTTWRFNDLDLKNLFLLAFGEHVTEETFYKKEQNNA